MSRPEARFLGTYSDREIALVISNMTVAGVISEEQMDAIVFLDLLPAAAVLNVEAYQPKGLRLSLVSGRTIVHFLPPE